MRKIMMITLALFLFVATMRFANAEETYLRAFKPTDLPVLNNPEVDYTSEFRKDLTVTDWCKYHELAKKPPFQELSTKNGTISYFYLTFKKSDGTPLLVRVSFYESKEETAELNDAINQFIDRVFTVE